MHPTEQSAPDVFVVSGDGGGGLTRRQAQGRRFVTPTRGIRARAVVADQPDVAVQALTLSRPDTVLTDLSAAADWGLPLPPWLIDGPSRVSLTVPSGRAHARRVGARGRRLRLPPEHLTRRNGRWIATPARTWLDCCAQLPLAHVVAMGDAVLHGRLAPMVELTQLVAWARGRRGVVTARRALPLLDAGAESPGESLARVALVSRGVRTPDCNADVFDLHGGWLARVDMLWREERVVVEYDGIVHLPEERRRSDAVRRNLLQRAGYLVIVLTARDLAHPEDAHALVAEALRTRSPR